MRSKEGAVFIHQESVLGHSVPAIWMGFLAVYNHNNIYHIIGCVLEQIWFAGIYYPSILPVLSAPNEKCQPHAVMFMHETGPCQLSINEFLKSQQEDNK